ncbi:hypothetical protein M5D96_013866 [Drosophila gunungcola]|uniref:Uncharacterized protein n=1 Tax=Drosophila gunungcola TaxID=103775 RepID=A0A9P9YAK9_9MUSC|nr:hypothetical protein M5D96_013866 [Drosophila gunungcola]
MQHKKLDNLQSELMHKIRTLAPQKLQGVYKFVAVVVNEKCKVVVHADDLHRLPKNLPTESVHDLKERCRAVVDSCFMLFYDHLQLIQKSKDEHEARNQREKIRNKLKEHCDQMNQLRSEYEDNLADELAACDHTISELKKSLRRSEDVVEELSQLVAEKSAALANEDGIIGELRIELGKLRSLRMHHRLEEAHVGPDIAPHFIDKQLAQIAFLVGELKEAREHIVNLQQRQDFMDKGVIKKDLVIADLKLQMRNLEDHKNFLSMQTQSQVEGRLNKEMTKLREKIDLDQQMLTARNQMISSLQKTEPNWTKCTKEEESRKLFGILKFKQREVRRQEHVIQLLKEQIARGSMALKEQEVRIVTMQEEIKHLKQTLHLAVFEKVKLHHWVIELNKVRGLEIQHKKLDNLQSELMHKIRTLAPQKLQGVYKFVAVVVNEKCKVVVHADDLHRLPKNLPTESVHDLKERCRAVVDSCFMLFYDHLQLIQKSKDEHEARNQREKIRNKLKEHCDQMNQLRSEYEANLADELAACDHTISELKKSLRRSEDVVEELSQLVAEKSAALANEDGIIGELRIELGKLRSLRMHHRLEEAHVGPDIAPHFIDKQLAQIAFLVGELKEAREHIVNLQQRQDFMDKGVIKKDLVIADLKLQMRNLEDHQNFLSMQKEEESRKLFGILKFKQREVRRQEHVIQLLKEEIARGSMALKVQEVRIVIMQEEIKHLKQTLCASWQSSCQQEQGPSRSRGYSH